MTLDFCPAVYYEFLKNSSNYIKIRRNIIYKNSRKIYGRIKFLTVIFQADIITELVKDVNRFI